MTFLADQIPQPYHFSAVINPVMIEVLENLAPFKLRFIGDVCQLLPQAFFNHPHKDAVRLFFQALFLAHGELFQVTSDSSRQLIDLGSR